MQANGSAEGTALFVPVSYTTSEDPRGRFPGDDGYGQDTGGTSGGGRRVATALIEVAAMGGAVAGLVIGLTLSS
jgi:hypothetical protein